MASNKVKCPHCGEQLERDEAIPFRKRYYHDDCLFEAVGEDEYDKHMFYLDFQTVVNRVPAVVEWTQCERLIDNGWSWRRVHDVFMYTYVVEEKPISNEHGTIGILPYMEFRAKEFLKVKWEADDHNLNAPIEEEEEIVVYTGANHVPHKPSRNKPKADIDSIINDDNLWED